MRGRSSLTAILQGAGIGFVFTPLQVVAFATMPAELRTDGTALFSLVRNVGSAIGISVTSFLLAQNTQIVHAQLAEHVTPFNRMLQTGGAYLLWNTATQAASVRSTPRSPGRRRSSPMSTTSS